ncbi:GNAT family N-acetyltransferase [Vibrio panuliri]|uniref:GNAT family N-acetyltransferase n=1 Tax=Vibrio panuliri TaxID=1381081 RepID=A0ABX3FIZ2_9VIBR|nr:GNAT family N-acetyltransferase [Vibrio panuliri]KAB1454686.1 GNAT family N-acetyltransferase [Vibrio panuliri]OLQ94151.1 GNAT family N-acetyltransferase [Vibrio panuliri]
MSLIVKPILAEQNEEICNIIKTVGAEFGAIGEGFGPSDAEVEAMSHYYTEKNKSLYLVATIDGDVVGGCGLAPLNHSDDICELKKLFLLPQSRGLGLGKKLTLACLDFAKQQGFSQCYLDTLSSMHAAITLYEKVGFEHLDAPIASSIHGSCDVWMIKSL